MTPADAGHKAPLHCGLFTLIYVLTLESGQASGSLLWLDPSTPSFPYHTGHDAHIKAGILWDDVKVSRCREEGSEDSSC